MSKLTKIGWILSNVVSAILGWYYSDIIIDWILNL